MAERNAGELTQPEFQERVVRILSLMHGLHMGQIDYLLTTVRQAAFLGSVFDLHGENAKRLVATGQPTGDIPN
jgi:hypothetical protein